MRVLVTFPVLSLFFAAVCSAQIKNTGTALGRVTGQSGAVVPNATVSLRNTETGAIFNTQTDVIEMYHGPASSVRSRPVCGICPERGKKQLRRIF